MLLSFSDVSGLLARGPNVGIQQKAMDDNSLIRMTPLGDALKKHSLHAGRFALTGVAAAALCFGFGGSAWALGLGKLTVQSALGESLRAEIDVTSLTPDEAANLNVRVAPPESYRAAGIDYNAILPGTRATLLRRPDGRPFLRLSSDRVVQEPFVDVILELSWSTGRLVREYTLLMDPPSNRPPAATAAVTTPPALAAAPQPTVTLPVPPRDAAAPTPTPPKPAEPRAPVTKPVEPTRLPTAKTLQPAAVAGSGDYVVRGGDTLSKIAAKTQPPGVSLEQMLVALFRGNSQAFIESNMNRLKAGAVLAVPSVDSAKSVSVEEARELIQVQSADFGAYRQRLAGAAPVAKAEAQGNARQDSGKVQASVDDRKQPAGSTPDKLTLSKAAATAKASALEEGISKEREKKEAAARVAELSKNVDELKKLSGAAAAAASEPGAAAPAPQVAASSAVPQIAVPIAPPVTAAAPSAADPSASSAVAAAKAASGLAGVKPPVGAAAEPEQGLMSSLMANDSLTLALGGGLLALLGGFGAYRLSRRAKKESGETSFLESRLQPDSFFGGSGGQRVDTREAGGTPSSMSYSLSQLDAIGDVDPVAEADVYLAYGRDLQAEEILKEAMRSSPDRLNIRTKLLEVYAKRRDTKSFESLATQLFTLTNGVGDDWAKAQALGAQIDPENPLYRPGGEPQDVDVRTASESFGESTMPQSVLPQDTGRDPFMSDRGRPDAAPVDLDLDLGFTEPDHVPDTAEFELPELPEMPEMAKTQAMPLSQGPDEGSIDFNMGADEPVVAVEPRFELTPEPEVASPKREDAPLEFDLSGISLDLDSPEAAQLDGLPGVSSGEMDTVQPGTDDDSENDPLARKLELAEEFRQIGDMEGARDLLSEVIAGAQGALKSKAQSMLDNLS